MQEALSWAAEKAELDKGKPVLAAQRESIDETTGRLREALALVREERAVLEVELTEAKNRPQQQQRNNPKNQPGNKPGSKRPKWSISQTKKPLPNWKQGTC